MRVNSVESGLCQTDLETVLGGTNLPATLHLPKVRDRLQLKEVWRTAERLLGTDRPTLGLIIFIETAHISQDDLPYHDHQNKHTRHTR